MSQTKTQLVTNVASGFNVTGVVTATEYKGAGQNLSGIITTGLGNQTIAGNLTLDGNLTVKGSQTIINSDTLDVKDKTVGIASTSTPTSATQNNSGIEIYGPSNVTIKYEDQKGAIGINTGLTVSGVITATGGLDLGDGNITNVGEISLDKVKADNGANWLANMGTNKNIMFSGAIGEIGNVTGFQAVNDAANSNTDFGIRGTSIRLATGSAERVRIASNGRVGIGSAIPAATLDLQSTDTEVLLRLNTKPAKNGYLDIVSDANRRGVIRFQDTGGTSRWSIGKGDSDELSNTSFHISSGNSGGNTAKLRITSEGGFKFSNASLTEKVKITAGKLSDNQNINLDNGMVHYFTTTETTTSTPNITASAGINTIMSAGDTMVVTIITTAAAGAYSAQLTIEGAATTENWIGGEVPAAGGASGVDIYSYTIIKTGAGTTDFTVIGNLSKTSA